MNRCIWLMIVTVAGLACSPAGASIVVNGGFETGTNPPVSGYVTLHTNSTAITGWTVTGHSVDWIGNYWQSFEGQRSLDLAGLGDGGVFQSNLVTKPGYKYQLSFAMAGNPDGGPTTKTMLVKVDGLPEQEFTFSTAGHSKTAMGWAVHTLDFVADSASTILSFRNKHADGVDPYYGAALDAVTVEELGRVDSAIPEPATLAVWSLLGLSGAGMWMVRRRKGSGRAPWSEESRAAIHQIVGRSRA